MKVLIDTNILVDFLAKRPQFFNNAQIIIKKCKIVSLRVIKKISPTQKYLYIHRMNF